MKILTRYILWNVLLFFLTTLFMLSGIFACFVVSQAVIMQNVPFLLAIRLVPYSFPETFRVSIPVSLLLACCFCFARMTSKNEIIALKSMGVSIYRILLPTWILAIILSFLCVWCNDITISWGRPKIARVALEGLESTILNTLRTKKRFVSPHGDFCLEVSEVRDDNLLLNPVLSNGKGIFQGSSKSARLKIDLSEEIPQIEIVMNATFFEGEGGGAILPEHFSYKIALPQFSTSYLSNDPPLSKINQRLEQLNQEEAQLHRELAAKGVFALVLGNPQKLGDSEWVDRAGREENLSYRRNRCNLWGPRCWASGFTCFFFIWLGIPFTIWLNKTDYMLSFSLCFFGVLIFYYPLLMLGIWGGKSGMFPPHFVWGGNFFLGLVGFWFLKKINQH